MRHSIAVALALIVVFAGSVIAYGAANPTVSGPVNVDISNVPVKQAIDTIFDGRGLKYYVQPGVKGKIVELKLKGLSVDEALRAVGDAAGFSFRIEDGAYIIGPGAAQAKVVQPVAQVQDTAPPQQSVTVVGAGPAPPPPPQPQPVIVNNVIPMPSPDSYSAPASYPSPYFFGGWSPVVNLGNGPYVFGRFPQPPPPPGWFSPDMERFLRFQWAVPFRPGYAAPYPYYYP